MGLRENNTLQHSTIFPCKEVILTDDSSIKDQIRQHFDCRGFLQKSSGCSLYICPVCGSGSGRHQTGAVQYYADTQRWFCHKCGSGGDIFTLYQLQHNVNFNTALHELADQLDVTKPRRSGAAQNRGHPTSTPAQTDSNPAPTKDLSDYFAFCHSRICDADAVSYLAGRGISLETAKRCGLGYDPRADPSGRHCFCPRIIIPSNEFHYVARSIDPHTKSAYRTLNNRATPGIFRERVLLAADGDAGFPKSGDMPLFVTEGVFDALSIMEVGGQAVALNSTANRKRLLDILQAQPSEFRTGPRQVVRLLLCLDNDEAGWDAAAKLAQGLYALGIPFQDVCADVCGSCQDPNEALCADRNRFADTIHNIMELYNPRQEETP